MTHGAGSIGSPKKTTTTTTADKQAAAVAMGNAPTMKQASEEGQFIKSGQRGESVQRLQEMLASRGYDTATDGKFGPQTKAAIEKFQRDTGCQVDGVVGPETLGALGIGPGRDGIDKGGRTGANNAIGKAPSSSRAPALPALPGEAAPTTSTSVVGPLPAGAGDARVAELQRRTMASATQELDAGVREDPSMGNNRSARIDQYAKSGGMNAGQEWCGHFTAFNYTTAAKGEGLKFSGQDRMHSYQKARSYFMYSNYTDNKPATKAKDAALRESHVADGSARRYMTFPGSTGDRYASQNKLPHEVIASPQDMPLRAGDTALFSHGHVGLVESYNPATGLLTTIEGNSGNKVARRTYDLNDPAVRAKFDGFGRPASGDFA
ncbi:MAG: peptidoglycan-binding domain-containing protein [Deltaproteobacteria bacterium]|nr:peptidoglycan-binding domain-containing protein [Deltaproteobacteria bacterium]